jgi:putative phosphoesterase
MTRIGILSDTHGYFHRRLPAFLEGCDEIWHAGDIGTYDVVDKLRSIAPLRAVYGNIDGQEIRKKFQKVLLFDCEQVRVLMTHIGGYPGHYAPGIKTIIMTEKPGLFVAGHSHILKVINDKAYGLLHINPGAAGTFGLHKVITAVKLNIDVKNISNLEILEIQLKAS